MQRGRDHGIPDYNSMRKFLGLKAVKSFADITSNKEFTSRLNKAYSNNVDNCDLWVGIIA